MSRYSGNIYIQRYRGYWNKKKNPPFIFDKEKEIIKIIKFIIKNKSKIKIKSLSQKKYYLTKYSMKNITKHFLKKNVKNFF